MATSTGTRSWKPFPSDYLEKRLDLVPVDLFETGKEDGDEIEKSERLSNYPDYPSSEDEGE